MERAIQSSISTNNKNNADSAAAALWNRPFEPIIKSFTFCFLSVCFNFMAFSTLFLYYFYFHVSRNEIVLHLMNFYVALLLSKFIAARCLSFYLFFVRPLSCSLCVRFNAPDFIAPPTDLFLESFNIPSIRSEQKNLFESILILDGAPVVFTHRPTSNAAFTRHSQE